MEPNVQKVRPYLMFFGDGEEAMNLYISIFDGSEILHVTRQPGSDKMLNGIFVVKGQQIMAMDNPDTAHRHSFTPALSLFVDCDSEAEIDRAFAKLAEDGQVRMELAASPWSKKFGWVEDRYGVNWQLNLP